MPLDYAQYKNEITADVAQVLADASCQPILFVGSGFSKRYANGPNWEELLTQLSKDCPLIDKDFAYYKQAHNNDLKKVGSVFSDLYREWAWGKGRAKFPDEFFHANSPRDIFIKYAIAQLVKGIGADAKGSYGSAENDSEIEALKAISPHAVITTNYDEVLEPLFPDYERVVGQQILRKPFLAIGEIFKIHGCISNPDSIVINEADYDRFSEDHKYLSAKLLTYFIEHPLLFIGYRAEDPNIKSILSDVDRMVRASEYELVPNIYILEWDSSINDASYPPRDKVLPVSDGRNIRIKSITASSFEWVFRAFGQAGNLEKINTKLLRALMARSVELIRSDIPKKHVEIDFKTLEHAVNSGENFAKLFGVTSLDDPAQVNLNYKYVLSGVAEQLGLPNWNAVQKVIDVLKESTGFDIKSTDNRYHITMRTGQAAGSKTHKYSEAAVDLLRKVYNGEEYALDQSVLNLNAEDKK
ncbi:SIR2 family protein [Burkholderia thailandensis]|uniref:SIR2 family protein n=1 Tax=Burkholderia thailandensis TaxID=57975 RepID=UPI0005729C11|nr:SIR2 family protein [Burkholderia thailandensis]MCS3390260.1 SIR2 family protein [Burkholderia thailandensis]MCS6425798.1 SIR2 family protein [Burkholderia thailandensis]MCS6454214.1 SIR2 family protein [Burkholderia thailandensis]MCS6462452.1 SIR2 family protein [Burkholderia thailandensis]MCS6483278.1 SIR2 family protein [Burkholderia thailandensis]